jgi:multidrug efflux pump subunit AcrB
MARANDDEIQHRRNTARFFTENRQISWVLLVAVIACGFYGFEKMPKRKDPNIPVRVATAITPWPGQSAEKIEQLVTRQVEQKIAENSHIHPLSKTTYGIRSLTLTGVSIVQVQLGEDVSDTQTPFNDIGLRLNSLNASLPEGAGPIQFNSGFGDTAALLLTVASPKERDVEVTLRARDIERAIRAVRAKLRASVADSRVAVVVVLPRSVSPEITRNGLRLFADYMQERGFGRDSRVIEGAGFAAIDFTVDASDEAVARFVTDFLQQRLGAPRFHPDAWDLALIHDPKDTLARLRSVVGDKYSYAELDDFTDLIMRELQSVPQVSIVQRSGVLQQQVWLSYSQEQLASYGLKPANLKQVLALRNTPFPGGVIPVDNMNVVIEPSGEFTSAQQIADVIISETSAGAPVYLRDVVDIHRGYQNPPQFLNYYTWRDSEGKWQRSRAISLAVQMHAGQQIGQFGAGIDQALAKLRTRLPEDLVIARTSDQPLQVSENIDLFMTALYEAIALVAVVALLGFWEWRSALLMMFAIPITLAMTFAMIYMLGIELQQVSVATLIIALGLLVDDPVVAGDAIKRDLAAGHPRLLAAWLGPTKLASAILFATITNVVAYLPLLLLTGNTEDFLHSLPIVMACALIASRLVSLSFVPLLGFYLLRPKRTPELSIEQRRTRGFSGVYCKVGTFAIEHRRAVLAASLLVLAGGAYLKAQLKDAFFPDDVQYLSYVDVWLRDDATLLATDAAARQAEQTIIDVAKAYGEAHPGRDGKPREVLQSIATFAGGGAPRFWFSVTPELNQLNYAQLLVRVADKDDTPRIAGAWQDALSAQIPGAYVDVRQLQTNPVEYPVAVRLYGRATVETAQEAQDIQTLRRLAREVRSILDSVPLSTRVRNDWGEESFTTRLDVDPDRANLAGISNYDVASSSTAAINGVPVATLLQGDKQIPVVAQLRLAERARLSDLNNLYVYSSENKNKVSLRQIASINYGMKTERIRRQEHFRMVTVFGFPVPGALSSEVIGPALAHLEAFGKTLPPGYTMEISGEYAKTTHGFGELLKVMMISVALIFAALVFQFKNAVKPLVVFAAVPYGIVGALVALYLMNTPFGYMAFLGIVALIGVIVSHVIVLFDFIEEMHGKGEPLRQALLDAGIVRLRPVLITIAATVLALGPLAIHGGPLWQPLCYAQIGGLIFATFATLLLVPVIYSIFVLDLGIVRWDGDVSSGKMPRPR